MCPEEFYNEKLPLFFSVRMDNTMLFKCLGEVSYSPVPTAEVSWQQTILLPRIDAQQQPLSFNNIIGPKEKRSAGGLYA